MTQTILTDRFEEALVYAVRLHRFQCRKVTGTPYVAHLLSVAALVLEDGGDEDEAIAALLHDAVEDQGGAATRTEILRRFGERATAIVDGCTESEREPQQRWRAHKQRYLAQVAAADAAVQRVVLADKLHNGRSLLVNVQLVGDRTWGYFVARREELLWLNWEQVKLFQRLSDSWMVRELAAVVERLEQSE